MPEYPRVHGLQVSVQRLSSLASVKVRAKLPKLPSPIRHSCELPMLPRAPATQFIKEHQWAQCGRPRMYPFVADLAEESSRCCCPAPCHRLPAPPSGAPSPAARRAPQRSSLSPRSASSSPSTSRCAAAFPLRVPMITPAPDLTPPTSRTRLQGLMAQDTDVYFMDVRTDQVRIHPEPAAHSTLNDHAPAGRSSAPARPLSLSRPQEVRNGVRPQFDRLHCAPASQSPHPRSSAPRLYSALQPLPTCSHSLA